jgi:hypothetical protein
MDLCINSFTGMGEERSYSPSSKSILAPYGLTSTVPPGLGYGSKLTAFSVRVITHSSEPSVLEENVPSGKTPRKIV